MSHCFPPLSVYVQLLELTNQDITWEQRRAIFFSNKPYQESASCFEPLRKLWLVSILNFLHFSTVSVLLMISKWVFKLIFSSEIMIMTIRLKDWISNIVYNVEESKVFRFWLKQTVNICYHKKLPVDCSQFTALWLISYFPRGPVRVVAL